MAGRSRNGMETHLGRKRINRVTTSDVRAFLVAAH